FQNEFHNMGGGERSCLALANWLETHGLPHRLVLYYDTYGIAAHASHPFEVVQLRPRPSATSKIVALHRYFRDRPAGSRPPLVSGYQPALHATLAGLRRFNTLMHDTPSLLGNLSTSSRGRFSSTIVGYGLRRAAALGGRTIVTSEYLQEECFRIFGVKADIVRMGGMQSSAAFHIRPVQSILRILSVSRVEASKRIDWILKSLAGLERDAIPLSSRIDWRLDVAGTGSQLQTLQSMAFDLGLACRVFFHGFVSDEEVQTLYRQAHLFLMPARQGYGIPAIEALQRGIPVLLHRESGVSDILLNTPWATVLTAGQEGMTACLRDAINSVIQGRHRSASLPHLPTEDEWAENVARLCAWIS
ncbi:MAG TPA: glycosyltransferase, partial [Acidobacteriaceae bacterium]|nr:glycosyltransferase [Acidobacteriaceae bacterium]